MAHRCLAGLGSNQLFFGTHVEVLVYVLVDDGVEVGEGCSFLQFMLFRYRNLSQRLPQHRQPPYLKRPHRRERIFLQQNRFTHHFFTPLAAHTSLSPLRHDITARPARTTYLTLLLYHGDVRRLGIGTPRLPGQVAAPLGHLRCLGRVAYCCVTFALVWNDGTFR